MALTLLFYEEDAQAAAHERDIARTYEQRARAGLGDEQQYLDLASRHHDRALYFTPSQGTA